MPAGRPEKPIDWKLLDELLEVGCNAKEIAANFDLYHTTLYDRVKEKYGVNYTEYASKFKCKGYSKLRRSQFEKAINNNSSGNVQMLIWLGKNLLGQKDSSVQENTVSESTMTQFNLLMKQISDLQSVSGTKSDLNIDDNNMMSEQKS